MGDTKFRQTHRRTANGPYKADERKRRQEEGAERNAAWQALSTTAKIASLLRRPGSSKRQLTKLVVGGLLEPTPQRVFASKAEQRRYEYLTQKRILDVD